ncbi:MAG TPA: hypothetical protein VMS73_09410 [Anaerolineaceae bacterium]|nr:hypothetical protein [Anaerolineaceae bacterium]
MEAKNYAAAAHLIRQKNPFGEVCGLLWAAETTCQRDCYQRDFAKTLVQLADLQRWVYTRAGNVGQIQMKRPAKSRNVATKAILRYLDPGASKAEGAG